MRSGEEVLQAVKGLPGEIGLVIEKADGSGIRFQPDVPVNAASVIKLFVMAEAFRQREQGELDFAREVSISREQCCPSCGAVTYLHDGVRLQVGDLVTLMIILSDNTATNVLLDMLGLERVQEEIERLGLAGTRIRRKLFQEELSRQGIQNQICAGDVACFLNRLMQGRVVNAGADREMLGILANQRLNGKIPFYLHEHGIRCAHKTGEDDGITHDCGIIWNPEPVVFCFVSEHTNVPKAERVLQDAAAWAAGVEID